MTSPSPIAVEIHYDLTPTLVLFIPKADLNKSLQPFSEMTQPTPNSEMYLRVRLSIMSVGKDSPVSFVFLTHDTSEGPTTFATHKTMTESLATSLNKNKNEPSRLVLSSGDALVFRRAEDCNCGSRLRDWSPYKAFREFLS